MCHLSRLLIHYKLFNVNVETLAVTSLNVFLLKRLVVQSLQRRGVQPGVAAQGFSRMKRRWRGRGPGRRADLAGVALTGSTVLMPGEGTEARIYLNSVNWDFYSRNSA